LRSWRPRGGRLPAARRRPGHFNLIDTKLAIVLAMVTFASLRQEAAAIDGAGLLLLSIDTRWQTVFSKEFAPARVLAKDLRRGRVPRRPATGWLSGAYLSNPTGIRRLLDRARSCAIGCGQPMGTRPDGLAGPRRIDEARGRDGGLGQSG